MRVEVENDGPPISPEAVRSLFDPFQGSSGAATDVPRAHAGLGLGLFIVRSIVEAHGGMVEVESPPARPVTFTVCLPRTHPAPRLGAASTSFWRPTRAEGRRGSLQDGKSGNEAQR